MIHVLENHLIKYLQDNSHEQNLAFLATHGVSVSSLLASRFATQPMSNFKLKLNSFHVLDKLCIDFRSDN